MRDSSEIRFISTISDERSGPVLFKTRSGYLESQLLSYPELKQPKVACFCLLLIRRRNSHWEQKWKYREQLPNMVICAFSRAWLKEGCVLPWNKIIQLWKKSFLGPDLIKLTLLYRNHMFKYHMKGRIAWHIPSARLIFHCNCSHYRHDKALQTLPVFNVSRLAQ